MGSIFTIPNQLTLLRMLLVPVFVTFMIYKRWGSALFVFVTAALTDALDGYLARRLNQKTLLGAVMDPLSDKVMMVSSFVVLSEQGLLPPWLTVIVVSRDALLVGGVVLLRLFGTGELRIEPAFVGKLTTFFQVLTVAAVLSFKVASFSPGMLLRVLYGVTAAMTLLSGYVYFRRGRELLNHAGKGN